VSNGKYRSLSESQDAAIYEALLGSRSPNRMVHLLIRTSGAPESVAPAVRDAVLGADGSAAVTLNSMRAALAFAMLPSQMGSTLLGLMGGLGMLLAMVGLFGVISFAVSRRTGEIAIRMALGASRGAVLTLVLGEAARLVVSGVAVGLLLAWLVTRPLSAFLVSGVDPGNPVVYAVAAGLLMLASLTAVWGPVIRAMGIAPGKVLKAE